MKQGWKKRMEVLTDKLNIRVEAFIETELQNQAKEIIHRNRRSKVMDNMVELVEEHNEQGVCVRRTLGGVELKADTEPSVAFFGDAIGGITKKYLTEEEAKKVAKNKQ